MSRLLPSFPHLLRIMVWRSPKEAFHPNCYVPRVKNGAGLVMVCAAISCYSLGPLLMLDGCITAKHCWTIQEDHGHPVQTLFTEGGAVFQDENAPTHTNLVRGWFEFKHLLWHAQPPDLNISEQLGRASQQNIFLYHHHIVTWPLFCKRNGSKIPLANM